MKPYSLHYRRPITSPFLSPSKVELVDLTRKNGNATVNNTETKLTMTSPNDIPQIYLIAPGYGNLDLLRFYFEKCKGNPFCTRSGRICQVQRLVIDRKLFFLNVCEVFAKWTELSRDLD